MNRSLSNNLIDCYIQQLVLIRWARDPRIGLKFTLTSAESQREAPRSGARVYSLPLLVILHIRQKSKLHATIPSVGNSIQWH